MKSTYFFLAIALFFGCTKPETTYSTARSTNRPLVIGWHGTYGGDTVSFDTAAVNVVAVTSSTGAIEYTYSYNTYFGNPCSISVTDMNGGNIQPGDILTSRAVTYNQQRHPENDTLFQLLTPYPATYSNVNDSCRIDLYWCVAPFNGLSVQAFILLNCE